MERRQAAQRDALVYLTGLTVEAEHETAVFERVTETVAAALDVSRVSVWFYTSERTGITCADLFERDGVRHSRGLTLARTSCPLYFDALRTRDVIVADDARIDPRTCEFTPDYLVPLGITSMLDAPLHLGGVVEGVLCCEHQGDRRTWAEDETTFVIAAAQVVSRLLEQAERARAETGLRLRSAALNAAVDAIALLDAAGTCVWANDAYGTLSLDCSGAQSPRSDVLFDAQTLRDVMSTGRAWSGHIERTRSGRAYWGHQTISPVSGLPGPVTHVVLIERDLTSQHTLEQQLLQSQKMEAVGQLAGGIAHDFNNLLTIIGGHAQLLVDDQATGRDARTSAREIVDAAARAGGLTRQLLAFSRHQPLTPQVVDLHAVLTDLRQLLARALGTDIELVLELQAPSMHVRIDRVQFEQVVVNVAVNARAAMPGGGRFVMRTRICQGGDGVAAAAWPQAPAGPLACVQFVDSGHGMSDDVRQRVFEPFFSTRDRDKGTGLGLSTAYGIVTQSGGHIAVESRLGEGSTFTVCLPLAPAPASAPSEPAREPAPDGGGHERVLVAEDDPIVRQLVAGVLRRAGYTVLEAQSAVAARALVAPPALPPDLLLTDVVMPGESGDLLYESLREACTGMRAIFMSGYAPDRQLRAVARSGVAFLAKPFTPQVLLAQVRSVLDAPLVSNVERNDDLRAPIAASSPDAACPP